MEKFKLGIIGAGNMAGAVLNGILCNGLLTPSDIVISDIDVEKLIYWKNKGVNTVSDNELLLKNAEFIILAVKPQVARSILGGYKSKASGRKFISIMAGIDKRELCTMLGGASVARVMPNTPCLVGEGMCAVDAEGFSSEDKLFILDIFGSLGKVIELPETLFHAVTAVSGSGPAYVYMFIGAMIKGGVNAGLDEKTARLLTLQTFYGAAKMSETFGSTDELIKKVCSPNGTTIEAVNYFKEADLEKTIAIGMEKCEKRSKELSGNA